MNYIGFLISNFATGLDGERQPWLLPNDAQFELLDGYVYLGIWQKRQGYSQLATGQRAGSTYTESRMIHTISGFATTGTINSTNTVFTATLTIPSGQAISRGSVSIVGTNPSQIFTDNGVGAFTSGGASGTVDYFSGTLSITLPIAPTSGSVTVTYDLFQGLPVMGVMNFFTQLNTRELIVADTTYVNRYNTTTNRLVDISPAVLLTGDETNFFSWTNYPTPEADQRLLFVNYKDPIQQYDGNIVSIYPVYTASNVQTSVPSGVVGDGSVGPYTFNTPANTGILPGSLVINAPVSTQTVTDDQFGVLTGDGTGTVIYLTGSVSVTFNTTVAIGDAINITYTQLTTPLESVRHIKQFKDRAVLLSTIESGGVLRGLRIRISGTGAQGDVFTTDAIGAGFIDIPDQTFIQACDFNRDDLLIFTESSTWVMKYTGSDTTPFALDRIDETRGSQAPYGTITYLNRTSAASPRGLIITDGYSLERADGKLPDFSYNVINQERFGLCFAGSVDADRDHYLIYPSQSADPAQVSDRILVTNYEEDNLSIYRIPLSSMGSYIGAFNVTWDDLLIYDNWDQLAAIYGSWNNFAYSKGAPYAVGGGHEGQIFQLNVAETEDYPVMIRDITVIDSQTLQVTTDFQNYAIGDVINIESVEGMLEVNDKQAAISTIVTPNYVFNLVIGTTGFSAYSNAGVASKVIQFSSKTKKFNPFADQNQKVRCGWVYFYVSHAGTNLTDNKIILGASNTNPCVLNVPGHGYTTGLQIYVDSMQGMTELNGNNYNIVVVDQNYISLDGVDASMFGIYTSGGFTSTPTQAKMQVRVIVNDTEQSTLVNGFNPAPYEINLTNAQASNGIKKWYKLFINQVGRFVQFEFSNGQAGAKIEIQAIMPGFAGIGRLI